MVYVRESTFLSTYLDKNFIRERPDFGTALSHGNGSRLTEPDFLFLQNRCEYSAKRCEKTCFSSILRNFDDRFFSFFNMLFLAIY